MTLKDEILRKLSCCPGKAVSGQALAQELGVSRNCVWKAVQALRKDGFDISSATNRGYTLNEKPGRLSAAEISACLGGSIPVYVYDIIDSTNSEAKRRAAKGESSFLVLAGEQTAGRGRMGKSFYSPKDGGLYMSLATGCGLGFDAAVGMTAYACVCVLETIEELYGVRCGIKWVNDLYLNGRKVCGILTEAVASVEAGTVAALVVGIGINLQAVPLPEELESIVGFIGAPELKNRLAAGIAEKLLKYDVNDRTYMDKYRACSLVTGREVSYVRGGETVYALAVDIDASGGLIVRRRDGAVEVLRSGEISLKGIEGLK